MSERNGTIFIVLLKNTSFKYFNRESICIRTKLKFSLVEFLEQLNCRINVIELSVQQQELLILFIVICIFRNCM